MVCQRARASVCVCACLSIVLIEIVRPGCPSGVFLFFVFGGRLCLPGPLGALGGGRGEDEDEDEDEGLGPNSGLPRSWSRFFSSRHFMNSFTLDSSKFESSLSSSSFRLPLPFLLPFFEGLSSFFEPLSSLRRLVATASFSSSASAASGFFRLFR